MLFVQASTLIHISYLTLAMRTFKHQNLEQEHDLILNFSWYNKLLLSEMCALCNINKETRKQRGWEKICILYKQLLKYSVSDNVVRWVWWPVSPTFQIPSPSMKSGVKVCRGCSENKPNSIMGRAVTAIETNDKIT